MLPRTQPSTETKVSYILPKKPAPFPAFPEVLQRTVVGPDLQCIAERVASFKIKTLTQDHPGQKSAHGQENDDDDDARGIEVEGRFSVIELYIFLVCNLEPHPAKQNGFVRFIIVSIY